MALWHKIFPAARLTRRRRYGNRRADMRHESRDPAGEDIETMSRLPRPYGEPPSWRLTGTTGVLPVALRQRVNPSHGWIKCNPEGAQFIAPESSPQRLLRHSRCVNELPVARPLVPLFLFDHIIPVKDTLQSLKEFRYVICSKTVVVVLDI